MNFLRKRIRLLAFAFFFLFFTFNAVRNKAFAGTHIISKSSAVVNEKINRYDICGPAGIAALAGAVAAGVALVAGAYQLGTAVGEFARNIGAEVQLSNIDQQYTPSDFSEFDI